MPTKGLRPSEEWARQMMQRELGVVVEQYDDNSSSAMYDLEIQYTDDVPGAVEVVASADAEQMELWKVLYRDGRTLINGIAGGWLLTIRPPIRGKTLLRDLPALLGSLERTGIRMLDEATRLAPELRTLVDVNRIVRARQGDTDFPGSVYFSLDEPAAFLSDTVSLAAWVGEFLAGEQTRDVRAKLAASGAVERHAFVLLPPFTLAPAAAVDTLLCDPPVLPSIAPTLPPEITHVWLVSTWSIGHGLRWEPQAGWSAFSKLQL